MLVGLILFSLRNIFWGNSFRNFMSGLMSGELCSLDETALHLPNRLASPMSKTERKRSKQSPFHSMHPQLLSHDLTCLASSSRRDIAYPGCPHSSIAAVTFLSFHFHRLWDEAVAVRISSCCICFHLQTEVWGLKSNPSQSRIRDSRERCIQHAGTY